MGPAIKLQVSFRTCRRAGNGRVESRVEPKTLARQIALAHFIGEKIESGELASYAEAAERLGLTRARLSQVADLVLLAPEIQEAVLHLEAFPNREPVSERNLRRVLQDLKWEEQLAVWGDFKDLPNHGRSLT